MPDYQWMGLLYNEFYSATCNIIPMRDTQTDIDAFAENKKFLV